MTVRRVSKNGGLTQLSVLLKDLDGIEGRTGYFETAHYPNGTPVALVAMAQELGTATIPARPTMRPAVAQHGKEWMDLLGQGAKACLEGRTTPRRVMEAVALRAAGDVARKISELTSPPLSPKTVKRKGFDKPLIDSGLMRQSVTGVVQEKS